MAIRVALIGTGNCGSLALRQLIEDQRFELTHVWCPRTPKWQGTQEISPDST